MINPADIAALAELYDRYANAFEPIACKHVGNSMCGSKCYMNRRVGAWLTMRFALK